MADDVRVEMPTGKSKEEIALELYNLVSISEDKVGMNADRDYILVTYASCLDTVLYGRYKA